MKPLASVIAPLCMLAPVVLPAVPIFAGFTSSGIGTTITSAQMIDPYVPVDGTMNVTGGLTVTDTLDINKTAGTISFLQQASISRNSSTGALSFNGHTASPGAIINGGAADGAGAVAVRIAARSDLSTSGAKIASFGDNETTSYAEKLYIDKDGIVAGANLTLRADAGGTLSLRANGDITNASADSNGFTIVNGLMYTRETITGTDDGAGTARAVTYTPNRPYAEFDCQDANGCTVTFSETGAVEGEIVHIKVLAASTGTVTIADSAGVQMVSGASINLGDDDHVTFIYDGTQWDQHTAVLAIE